MNRVATAVRQGKIHHFVPHCCATMLAMFLPLFGGLNNEEMLKVWGNSCVVHDGSLGEVCPVGFRK
jgi:hypothetical protein